MISNSVLFIHGCLLRRPVVGNLNKPEMASNRICNTSIIITQYHHQCSFPTHIYISAAALWHLNTGSQFTPPAQSSQIKAVQQQTHRCGCVLHNTREDFSTIEIGHSSRIHSSFTRFSSRNFCVCMCTQIQIYLQL